MSIEVKQCNTCGQEYRTEEDFLKGTSRWRLCDLGNLWFNCACDSTLMVQKGKFDWYNPALSLSSEAAGVFNKLANIDQLPRIPATIMKVQNMLADENIDPKMLARALKSDPVTAASVIKHADNVKAARDCDSKPIQTIEHAIVYIGRKALRDIITAAAISNLKLPDTGYNYSKHWEKAFLCGSVAERLIEYFPGCQVEKDEIYLGATLANIGKLVSNHCFPGKVKMMVSDIKNPQTTMTWSAAEQAVGVPEHELLGEIAAALWGLPDYVADASRYHHHTINPKMRRRPAEIAALANQITHWLSSEPELIDQELLEGFKDHLGLKTHQLDQLVESFLPLREKAAS